MFGDRFETLWGPFVHGDEFLGTICPWGSNWLGTVCPGGPEVEGTFCPLVPNVWGLDVGDRKSGDQMGSGPIALQPYRNH